ncbi:hypothetical protein HDU98_009131 [Podochytrium sp. JEL0797]|nr:hypothetical protein HDU98_009131 [Podochytrium sp. JEL0797]
MMRIATPLEEGFIPQTAQSSVIEFSEGIIKDDIIGDVLAPFVLPVDDDEERVDPDSDRVPVTAELLKQGLSQLGKTPDGYSEVFLKLAIPNAGLNDISDLQAYKYVQNLDLSGNQLTELTCLGAMSYLVKLNVSNNKLSEVLAFDPPPFNLQEIDFSRNQIMEIADLSEHRFLKSVCLDRNLIKEINGLSECKFLTYLSLSFNGIRNICNLDHLPIKYLDLRSNRLLSLEGIETLSDLEDLLLSCNAIQHLTSLNRNHKYLRVIDLDQNQISDPDQIAHLKTNLRMLTNLSFKRNPIVMPLPTPIPGVTPKSDDLFDPTKSVLVSSANSLRSSNSTRKSFSRGSAATIATSATPCTPQSVASNNRLATAFQLQSLTVLDAKPLTVQEKVAAVNAFNPSPSVIASLQHSCLLKRQAKLYAKVKAEDLMRATYLRPIVLCGPSGAGKRPRIGEEQGTHYHFVSRAEMEAMVEDGKFAEVVTLFGCMYGTSMDSIDKVTEEGKVCIMDMEIEGVLALKRSHLKPIYVFITVPSLEILKNRLENRLRPATAQLNRLHVRPTHIKVVDTIQENSTLNSPNHSRPTSASYDRPVSGIFGDLDSSSRPISGLPPMTGLPPMSGLLQEKPIRPATADSLKSNASVGSETAASGINDDDDEIRKLVLQKGNGNYSLMNLVTGVGLSLPKVAVAPASEASSHDGSGGHPEHVVIGGHHHAPMTEEQLTEDIEKWLAKAPGVESYEKMKDFFDLTILNDDPDRAYAELRDFCLSTYIKCFNESE